MADESVLVPLSAIEHFSYCERQCALIHVEATFEENVYTLRGRLGHQRTDTPGEKAVRGVRVARAIPLWSDRLGLIGKSDVVEFRAAGPYPVEYKSGSRSSRHAHLQLCAQALCLEEMMTCAVPAGAIFHIATHRRDEIVFDAELRAQTLAVIDAVRDQITRQLLPAAPNDKRCRLCSLKDACLPEVIAQPHRLRGLQGALWRAEIGGVHHDD